METADLLSYRDRIVSAVSRAIVGKDEAIENVLICFLCGGHVLIEDVPGTGKTMLLRAFAKAVGGSFSRIQFTPDLLPSDLTGITFYDQRTGEFSFRKGPLFADMVLADEINRATPRTQSALLEAMEERQVTSDGVTYPLGSKFMVAATQNPIENYGTFPLPQAQVDRFMMRLSLGYMAREQELQVICREDAREILDAISPAVSDEETELARRAVRGAAVSDDVKGYIMDIVEGTREGKSAPGVSTRGAIALYRASRARAALRGRSYAIPEDVKALAPCVLAHRAAGAAAWEDGLAAVTNVLDRVRVPLEEK